MELRDALVHTETELAALRDRVAQLEIERDSLRSAIARLEENGRDEQPSIAPTPSDGAAVDPVWQRLTRTDAIVRILRESGPLGPTGIALELQARGRTDTNDLISATLAKLQKRGGRVKSVGRALWIATESDDLRQNVVPFPSTSS